MIQRKNQLKKEIQELEEKYREVLDEPCDICVNPVTEPVFYKCCQHMVCGDCGRMLKDMCPFCRSEKPSTFQPTDDTQETIEKMELKSLPKIVSQIANIAKSVIIFRNTCGNLEEDINQTVAHLKGTAKQRKKIIEDYKNGIVKILFLNLETDYAGVRLENTTDIIFLSTDLPDNIKNQIIGRALRLGRDPSLPLTIHELIEKE